MYAQTTFRLALALCCAAVAAPAGAQMAMHDDVMVGGQAMYAKKDIVTNAMNSADHTTLVAAVKAAGLVETLLGNVADISTYDVRQSNGVIHVIDKVLMPKM